MTPKNIFILTAFALLLPLAGCKEKDYSTWLKRRHQKLSSVASLSSSPSQQNSDHLLKRNDNFAGYTSRALANGNVVGLYDFSYPITNSNGPFYINIKYLVVTFVSEKTLLTGMIYPDSRHTTEVWKFVNDTWCPVFKANLNTTLTAKRNISLASDKKSIAVQIFTADGSGSPGEIAFNDTTPLENSCESNIYKPLIKFGSENVFYGTLKVGQDSSSKSDVTTYFNQSIKGLKVRSLIIGNYDNTILETSDKLLYFWTDSGCNGPLDANDSTGCKDGRIIKGSVWWAKYDDKVEPGKVEAFLALDPRNNKINQTIANYGFDGDKAYGIGGVDLVVQKIGDPPTTPYTYSLSDVSIMMNGPNNFVLVGDTYNRLNSLNVHSPDLKLKLKAPQDPNRKNQSSWPYDYRMTGVLNWNHDVLTNYSTTMIETDKVSLPIAKIQYLVMGPQGLQCFNKNSDLRSDCRELHTDRTEPIDNEYVVPAKYVEEHSNSITAAKYGGNLQPLGFSGVVNYARAEPVTAFATSTGDAVQVIGFRSIPSFFNANRMTSLRIFSPSPHFVNSATHQQDPVLSTFHQIPRKFSSHDYYYKETSAIPDGYMSFDISDPQVLLVKGYKPNQPSQVYILFHSRDFDKKPRDGQSQTAGGIYLCVAGYKKTYNTTEDIQWADCNKERLLATAEDPYPVGSKIILASDITNNSTYLSTPLSAKLSQTANGEVIINYVAANQGIFMVNATQMTGNNIKNWLRLQTGRNAECHESLKNTNNTSSFWGKLGKFSGSLLLSIVLDESEAEGGIFIEAGWLLLENFVVDSDEPAEAEFARLIATTCVVK